MMSHRNEAEKEAIPRRWTRAEADQDGDASLWMGCFVTAILFVVDGAAGKDDLAKTGIYTFYAMKQELPSAEMTRLETYVPKVGQSLVSISEKA